MINKLIEKLGSYTLGGKVFVTDVQTAVDLAPKVRGESAISDEKSPGQMLERMRSLFSKVSILSRS